MAETGSSVKNWGSSSSRNNTFYCRRYRRMAWLQCAGICVLPMQSCWIASYRTQDKCRPDLVVYAGPWVALALRDGRGECGWWVVRIEWKLCHNRSRCTDVLQCAAACAPSVSTYHNIYHIHHQYYHYHNHSNNNNNNSLLPCHSDSSMCTFSIDLPQHLP